MARSKIVITFTADATNLQIISFYRYKLSTPTTRGQHFEVFRDSGRTANSTVPTVITTDPPYSFTGEKTAIAFANFFNLDYSIFFSVSRSNNVITLTLKSDSYGIELDTVINTVTGASYVITNLPEPTFFLLSAVKSTNADACNYYDLGITATEQIRAVLVNRTLTNLTPNVFQSVKLTRGINNVIKIENASSVTLDIGKFYIDFLATDNITIGVVKSMVGATVNVNVINKIGLTLEVSIDGSTWFPITYVFTGQPEGDYVMHVRDQLGCVKLKEYTVDTFGTRKPYLQISDANSIGFKESVEWNGQTIFKNDSNTLALEGLEKIKYCHDVLFTNLDETTIQIKTNFTFTVATLRKDDFSEVILPIFQRSNNLNRYESMDAWRYKYNEQYTGIYFESGNTYTDEESIITTYALNGNLPDLAKTNNYITIKGFGTYKIEDVVYDINTKMKVILVDIVHTGAPEAIIVESVYDLLQFEVLEFYIDWRLYGNGTYDVKIVNTDPENGTITHLSENILIADTHPGTVATRYYNDNNRDIFYKYGIQHFIRIPLSHKKAVPMDEIKLNITDDGTDVIRSSVYPADEFKFGEMDASMMRKTVIALSCENLFIQNVGYAKEGSVDSNNDGNTNIYELTATLIQKGKNYNNNRNGETDDTFTDDIFDVPAFITDGTGFIKS